MAKKVLDVEGSPEAALKALRSAHYKTPSVEAATKYIEEGRVKRGERTSNYVVFDDAIVKILRKYGLPLTAGNAALAQSLLGGSTKAEAAEPKAKGGPVDHALNIARRAKRATGGSVKHVGPIHSTVAGRTDHLALDVPTGSYVIPADIVSGLGEGNTASGLKVLEAMFPPQSAGNGDDVPIMAAGGEYVIDPEAVKKKGGGDLDRGHAILDRWVLNERKKLVKTLKKLPGPARD